MTLVFSIDYSIKVLLTEVYFTALQLCKIDDKNIIQKKKTFNVSFEEKKNFVEKVERKAWAIMRNENTSSKAMN